MSRTEAVPPPATDPSNPMGPRRWVLTAVIFLAIPAVATLWAGGPAPTAGFDHRAAWILAVLLALRVLLFAVHRERRLAPLLELPMLGCAFALTGGAESPFDPALFLVYTLLAFYLEREPRRLLGVRWYSAFLVGFVAMYAILYAHVLRAQRSDLAIRVAEVRALAKPALDFPDAAVGREAREAELSKLRRALWDASDRGELNPDVRYFVPGSHAVDREPNFESDHEEYLRQLERHESALHAARARLDPSLERREIEAIRAGLEQTLAESHAVVEAIDRRLSTALDSAPTVPPGGAEHLPYSSIDVVFEKLEHAVRDLAFEPLARVDTRQDAAAQRVFRFIGENLREYKALEQSYADDRRKLLVERFSMAILVLATLALVAGLRAQYEEEVRRAEALRAAAEVRRKQEETENWIALTAGFTHTIGNDILAYDAWSDEALAALEDGGPRDAAQRAVRAIHDSNKRRLGFIRFLDEFARMRKARLEGAAHLPSGLARIDVEPLLRQARQHVAEAEVVDFPAQAGDPRVDKLRRKFESLPLDVRFGSDAARRLESGRLAVLQFFCYELFKNALRNASGDAPLRVEVEKQGDRARLRFINDLEIAEEAGPRGTIRKLPRLLDVAAESDAELKLAVLRLLERCFEPGRGGGTGLGLFLIRYFVREYYAGSISASIHDWSKREVAFTLDLPDDLALAKVRT